MDDAAGTELAKGQTKMPVGRPFAKGVSGNPSGRPSGQRIRRKIRRLGLLGDAWRAVQEHLALDPGDPIRQRAAEYVLTNYYGKPVERHQLEGPNGEPLKVSININLGDPDASSQRAE